MPSAFPVWQPVAWSRVTVVDPFWSPRQQVNAEVTIPEMYQRLISSGRLGALDCQWRPGMPNRPHQFWDSDVAKWLEAAAYAQVTHPTAERLRQISEVAARFRACQMADGYLHSYHQAVAPDKRYTNLRDDHELYCMGHFIEAAVAVYRAIGDRATLQTAERLADHLASVFGHGPGQKRGYCGHEELELALVKLWQATGERRHLELASYFVEERGQNPNYFHQEAQARGDDPAKYWAKTYSYCQAHLPVREQLEVTGHAVRATYLYCAMADLAGQLGDASLLEACQRLHRHLVDKRLYVTGSIGSNPRNEGFSDDYDLPIVGGYGETCAAIGLALWMERLTRLTGESGYGDLLERCLYNGILAGVSQDGRRFFYANHLSVDRKPSQTLHEHMQQDRQPWYGCACCPPNIARWLAGLGGLIYGESPQGIAIHQYLGSRAELRVGSLPVSVELSGDYVNAGRLRLTLRPARVASFTVALRVPDWSGRLQVRLGRTVLRGKVVRGYLQITREWLPGDTLEVAFNMNIQRLYGHPALSAVWGRVALRRGPVIYAIESDDLGQQLDQVALPASARLRAEWRPDLLGGVTVLTSLAHRLEPASVAAALYEPEPPRNRRVPFLAVPYHAWGNRNPGELRVWLRE